MHYNMNLFDAVTIKSWDLPAARLGYAAEDMHVPTSGYRTEADFNTHSMFTELDPDASEIRTAGAEFSDSMLGRWRLSYDVCDTCADSTWRECISVGTAGSVAAAPFFAHPGRTVAVHMRGDGVRPFVAASIGSGQGSVRTQWCQFGLPWRRQHGAYTSVAEVSRIDESSSVWGDDVRRARGHPHQHPAKPVVALGGAGKELAGVCRLQTQRRGGLRNRRHAVRHIRAAPVRTNSLGDPHPHFKETVSDLSEPGRDGVLRWC